MIGRADGCHLCLWEGESVRAWTEDGPGQPHPCLMPRHPASEPLAIPPDEQTPWRRCPLVGRGSVAVFPLSGREAALGYLVLQRAGPAFEPASPELSAIRAVCGQENFL